jgi:hypothetical protein
VQEALDALAEPRRREIHALARLEHRDLPEPDRVSHDGGCATLLARLGATVGA